VFGHLTETVRTGAYVPFGTETTPGQVIKGSVKCTGAVLRCNPDGSELELVAWGLRNPYGVAFHPDGRLFATEHNIDERSARQIIGDPEDLYEIKQGEWYGWPDFAAGIRLDDPYWGERGRGREPVIANHPMEETRRHAELVRGCIERLGEKPSTAKSLLGQMLGAGQSVATGMFRDEVVKNFLADFAAENFEIASYRALIAAARAVGDEETARVCEEILREERMAAWLTENLPRVVQETLRDAE
jgi:ferritin-like metal-binding protein YciE